MGMYDSVNAKCSCGADLEFQSEAGDCVLANYNLSSVPPEIAKSLDGDSYRCTCGKTNILQLSEPIRRVKMYLISED